MRFNAPILVAGLALLTACSGTGPAATASPSTLVLATVVPSSAAPAPPAPSPTPDRSKPVGLIAMGHSGITGEGTGEEGKAAPDKSWATGTLPDVNSVYLRMVGVLPETEGHVANAGHGGAPASELEAMADRALLEVPVPALSRRRSIRRASP